MRVFGLPSPLSGTGYHGVGSGVISFIQGLTQEITAAACALFVLTWTIGWTLRRAPYPSLG